MTLTNEERCRADIIEIGRRLHERAYVASNDGNISVRLGDDRLLTTPKGVSKGFMTPDMLVVTDLEGRKQDGEREPSSEIQMHVAVYRHRPEIAAVVHAHPPVATGFAVAGIPLDRAVLAEVVTTLGSIPIADYGTPSTRELAGAVEQHIKTHDALLLANHGALTVSGDVLSAYYKMETLEHFARISVVARLLGRERLLSREEVMRLQDLRGMYGIAAPAPFCPDGADGLVTDEESACQPIEAPTAPGEQLVASVPAPAAAKAIPTPTLSEDGEIRLTYRELAALIEDAVKHLR